MNLLKPAKGEVKVFGLDYAKNEKAIKERIGFVYDDNVFYEQATLSDMKKIIAPSYKQWDEVLFKKYVDQFELPLKKKMKRHFLTKRPEWEKKWVNLSVLQMFP